MLHLERMQDAILEEADFHSRENVFAMPTSSFRVSATKTKGEGDYKKAHTYTRKLPNYPSASKTLIFKIRMSRKA